MKEREKMGMLIEIEKEKCKEAIYKLLKGEWKVQLRYNNDDEEEMVEKNKE